MATVKNPDGTITVGEVYGKKKEEAPAVKPEPKPEKKTTTKKK